MTLDCLNSVVASKHPANEIIYVDNGSKDNSVDLIHQKLPTIKIIPISENIGFGSALNYGLGRVKNEIIFLLNNDTVIDKDCIKEILLDMQDKTIGCANTKILIGDTNQDLSVNKLGGFLGIFPYGVSCNYLNAFPDFATGTAMILRKEALEKVKMVKYLKGEYADAIKFPTFFDETFGWYWEDIDLSLRIKKAGYNIGIIRGAIVRHKCGSTLKGNSLKAKWYINKNRIKFLWREICQYY